MATLTLEPRRPVERETLRYSGGDGDGDGEPRYHHRQVYRNPGRVAPYTNYSGESIDLDLFDDDELGHPGDHSDDHDDDHEH